MSSNKDFSLEQSEELITNLKSGKPSDFQQLQSALNLLGHVTELPPTSVPPVLPSGITQPVPLLPVKSAKPRRTIVTSVIMTVMLASASLAAAAVTGIGPAPIVNIGHQTAKFVRGVASAVSNVVTGGNAVSTQNYPSEQQIPGLTPAPTGGGEGSTNTNGNTNSESSDNPIPGLPSPLSPEPKSSGNSKSNEGEKSKQSHESQSPQPHESQSPQSDESPTPTTPPNPIPFPSLSPPGVKEHVESEGQITPAPTATPELPTALPSPNSTDDSSDNE